jgi:hypothetical protein
MDVRGVPSHPALERAASHNPGSSPFLSSKRILPDPCFGWSLQNGAAMGLLAQNEKEDAVRITRVRRRRAEAHPSK